jgi:hypothetical protein
LRARRETLVALEGWWRSALRPATGERDATLRNESRTALLDETALQVRWWKEAEFVVLYIHPSSIEIKQNQQDETAPHSVLWACRKNTAPGDAFTLMR